MHRMGVAAHYRKRRTSIRARQAAIRPYLLSGLMEAAPAVLRGVKFEYSKLNAQLHLHLAITVDDFVGL